MRIEIRSSGEPKCPTCGAADLVFVPSANQHLEVELLQMFKGVAPWWRPIKRAALKHAHTEVEKACVELRDLTMRG